MSEPIIVRLNFEAAADDIFADYWGELSLREPIAKEVSVSVEPSAKPRTGLGLMLPPDVLFTIPPELIETFAKGVAGALGAGLGTWLWKGIVGFFNERRSHPNRPKQITIAVGKERVTISLADLSKGPPPVLKRLDTRR